MFSKPSRRELLFSGAAVASILAMGGLAFSHPALAQTASAQGQRSSTAQIDAYMGAPVEMATAPNGAITRKKLLDGIGKVAWVKPTIAKPWAEMQYVVDFYASMTTRGA